MTSVLSLASPGSQSSPSSSPSGLAFSPTPSASHPTLSLVAAEGKQRGTAVDGLAEALLRLEVLIQRTHAASAEVNVAFANAAHAEGLGPLTGHQFVSQMSRVTMHLADALGHSADGHRMLRRLGTSLGFDVTAYGDTACPDDIVAPSGQLAAAAA